MGYVTRTSPSEVYRWVGFNMIFSSLTKHRICNKFPGTFERSKVPKTRRAFDPFRLQAGVSPSTEAIDGLFINVVIFWCLALRYFLQLIFFTSRNDSFLRSQSPRPALPPSRIRGRFVLEAGSFTRPSSDSTVEFRSLFFCVFVFSWPKEQSNS